MNPALALLTLVSLPFIIQTDAMPQQVLGIDANHMVYDHIRGVVIAAVAENSPIHANSLVAINPSTAVVVDSLSLAGEPMTLAISDSSQTLLVALDEVSEIMRINPASLTQVGSFALPPRNGFEPQEALSISFAPGRENYVAIRLADYGGGLSRIAAFDNWLPLTNQSDTLINDPVFGSPSIIYVHDQADLVKLTLNANGVASTVRTPYLFKGSGSYLKIVGGTAYAGNGQAIDLNVLGLLGQYSNLPPYFRFEDSHVDLQNGVIVYANRQDSKSLRFFEMDEFRLIDELVLPLQYDPRNVVKWGTSGYAVSGKGTGVVFIQTSLAWSAHSYAPESLQIVRAVIVGGNLQSILESDAKVLRLRPGVTFTTSQPPIELIVTGHINNLQAAGLALCSEGLASSVNASQKVEFYNYQTSTYEVISDRQSTTTLTTSRSAVFQNAQRFVNSGTGEVKARISYKTVGPVFAYPWSATIDHIYWNATS